MLAFDLMDTLLVDPYREAHERATGLSWAQFESKRPDGTYHALERGEIDEDTYWAGLRAQGISVCVPTFHGTRRAGYRWLPGMQDLLRRCTLSFPTIIASNYPIWINEVRDDLLAGIDIEVFGSWSCGARKPAPAFFLALSERFDVSVSDLVLIDDSADNAEGLQRLGGRAVVFSSANLAEQQLLELGVAL